MSARPRLTRGGWRYMIEHAFEAAPEPQWEDLAADLSNGPWRSVAEAGLAAGEYYDALAGSADIGTSRREFVADVSLRFELALDAAAELKTDPAEDTTPKAVHEWPPHGGSYP